MCKAGLILQGKVANPVLTSSPPEHRPAAHWPSPPCQEDPSGPLIFGMTGISGAPREVIEQAEPRQREPGDVYPRLSLRHFGEPHVFPAKLLFHGEPSDPLATTCWVHIARLVPSSALVCQRVR